MSAVFVGRHGVLEALRAKLDDAFTGQGSLIALVGEAGIGKTAVAREFAAYARGRGATVLSGSCFEGGWQPAYAPWVEALDAYAGAADPARLAATLGATAPPLAQLIPALRAALPDTPPAAPLPPSDARVRLYDAVSRLLASVAQDAPLVLILDDLHWADRDTLRLLRYVARVSRGSPLLILGAYRDPEAGGELTTELLAVVRRESDFVRIGVGGLRPDEVEEYLVAVAGAPVPRRLAQAIHDETAGNPFYMREVIQQLVQDGKLADGAEVHLDSVPPGVRELLAGRIARLSTAARQVLGVACAFGGVFEFPLLATLTGLSEPALLDAIDELLAAGLIRTAGSRPGYDFAHAIVRHALADALNPDRLARLHRRIAQALDADRAAELAYQYYESRALPGAEAGIAPCRAAAQEAAAAYAPERAARFNRMAVELAVRAPPPERAEILCALAISEAEALLLDDSRASVESALAALAASGADPVATAAFLGRVSRTLKDGGASRTAWEPLVERGLEGLGERRDLTWARLTLLPDRIEVLSTGTVNASRLLERDPAAVAIAREQGDEDDYALTLEPLDCRTPAETESALALARRWRRPAAVMRALDVAGRDQLHRHGAFRESRETLTELLATSERYGSVPSQAEALVQLAAVHAALGDLALARETEERARELVGRLGPHHRLHLILDLVVATLLAYLTEGDWAALGRRAARFASSRETGAWAAGPGVGRGGRAQPEPNRRRAAMPAAAGRALPGPGAPRPDGVPAGRLRLSGRRRGVGARGRRVVPPRCGGSRST